MKILVGMVIGMFGMFFIASEFDLTIPRWFLWSYLLVYFVLFSREIARTVQENIRMTREKLPILRDFIEKFWRR